MKTNIQKYINKKHLLLLGLLLLVTSCYTPRDKHLLQKSSTLPKYKHTDYVEYKIGINDEILIKITTQDKKFVDLIGLKQSSSVSYRVYPDSTIDIPFVEKIKVAGKTLVEANKEVERRFKEIVPDARVKIALKNKQYTVIGDAGKGIFPVYKERLTIYQALAQSGEIALSGDRKHIKIIREIDGVPTILEFDIRPRSVIKSKYYYIYPNDIIYVQREGSSFYKTDNYSDLVNLITSSFTLFATIYYFSKYGNK
ncbi:MAG: hypothetical protein CR965_00645 [Paludibacter sp.]|nr:MAG: hypothetical protein CR965_00645 [Paludibacter sp.]